MTDAPIGKSIDAGACADAFFHRRRIGASAHQRGEAMLDRHRPPPRPPPPSSRDRTRKDRQRLYRQRAARGERIAPAPYDGAVVDFLVGLNWLREEDAGDRRLVGLAIGRMLAASARRR
jgi:hypothetical protein